MKVISAFKYYLKSISTLIFNTNFWVIPIVLIKKPVLLKTSKKLNFYVNNLLDIWTIKEVVLDHCYNIYIYIKKKDVVVDVGAGIGDFSIMASRNADKVYSVEMNRRLVQLFKRNVNINKTRKIEIINERLKSLDRLFNNYKINRCNFLKIDCEGDEYKIFKNTSSKTLEKINFIAFEIHLFNYEMDKNYQWLKNMLSNNGFILHEENNPVHSYLKFFYATKDVSDFSRR